MLHIRADVVHPQKYLREHALQLGHSTFELLKCLKSLLLLLQYVIPIDGYSRWLLSDLLILLIRTKRDPKLALMNLLIDGFGDLEYGALFFIFGLECHPTCRLLMVQSKAWSYTEPLDGSSTCWATVQKPWRWCEVLDVAGKTFVVRKLLPILLGHRYI